MTRLSRTVLFCSVLAAAAAFWSLPGRAADTPACAYSTTELDAARTAFTPVHLLQLATTQQQRIGSTIASSLHAISAHEAALQHMYSAEQQAFAALAPSFLNPDAVWQNVRAAFTAQLAQLSCDPGADTRTALMDALLLDIERNSSRYGTLNTAPSGQVPGLISAAPFRAWLEATLDAAALTVQRTAAEQRLRDWQRELQQTGAALQKTAAEPNFASAARQAPTCWPGGVRLPTPKDSALHPDSARLLDTLAARPLPFPLITLERAIACEAGVRDARQLNSTNLPRFLAQLNSTRRSAPQMGQVFARTLMADLVQAQAAANALSLATSPRLSAADQQRLQAHIARKQAERQTALRNAANAAPQQQAEGALDSTSLRTLITETGLQQRQRSQLTEAAMYARLEQLGRTWGLTLIRPPLDQGLQRPGAMTPSYLEGLIALSMLHGDTATRMAADAAGGRLVLWQPWVQSISCTATTKLYNRLNQIAAACLSPDAQQTRLRLLQQLRQGQ